MEVIKADKLYMKEKLLGIKIRYYTFNLLLSDTSICAQYESM